MIDRSGIFRKRLGDYTSLLPKWLARANYRKLESTAVTILDIDLSHLDKDELLEVLSGVDIDLNRQRFIEVWAVLAEVVERTYGYKPYATQLIAAFVALRHEIAEMDTGEGKTLSTVLAAIFGSLCRWPVHIVTANDFLAERDAELASPLADYLGLSVGVLLPGQNDQTRSVMFQADWLFSTGKELVFEYLRDQIELGENQDPVRVAAVRLTAQKVIRPIFRGLGLALIDEADSVLIDEASTPCVISQSGSRPWRLDALKAAIEVASSLNEGMDYTIQSDHRALQLTPPGEYRILRERSYTALGNYRYRLELVLLALKAAHLFTLNRDYVLQEGKVVIVDQLTGRLMPDRRWQDGLHEMVEAKHGLEISSAQQTVAKLSYQQFFSEYQSIGGMTGTAFEVKRELKQTYGLNVTRVERNHPLARVEMGVSFCKDWDEKCQVVAQRVKGFVDIGRPVLVGVGSVSESEQLKQVLEEQGVDCQVLNGLQDEQESELISMAGRSSQVTVVTSVAGRGTDIKLDDAARDAGGLHVILTEYLFSKRMDRQLIGRSARQGDPGSYEVICSSSDKLFSGISTTKKLRYFTDNQIGRLSSKLQSANEKKSRSQRQKMQEWEERKKSWLSFTKRS